MCVSRLPFSAWWSKVSWWCLFWQHGATVVSSCCACIVVVRACPPSPCLPLPRSVGASVRRWCWHAHCRRLLLPPRTRNPLRPPTPTANRDNVPTPWLTQGASDHSGPPATPRPPHLWSRSRGSAPLMFVLLCRWGSRRHSAARCCQGWCTCATRRIKGVGSLRGASTSLAHARSNTHPSTLSSSSKVGSVGRNQRRKKSFPNTSVHLSGM